MFYFEMSGTCQICQTHCSLYFEILWVDEPMESDWWQLRGSFQKQPLSKNTIFQKIKKTFQHAQIWW
jgi:hypothetical protein